MKTSTLATALIALFSAPVLASLVVTVVVGCSSPTDDMQREIALAEQQAPPPEQMLETDHKGPPVVAGGTGPARFVSDLEEGYDSARTVESVEFIDGFYRAPGNDGYEAVLDRLEAELREAGFGSHPHLELEVLESPLMAGHIGQRGRTAVEAWTPLGGRVVLRTDGLEETLHAFDAPEDVDRVMLPVNAPAGRAIGTIALSLEDLDEGEILVIAAPLSPSTLTRARSLGAAAVVSSSLHSFNIDTSGRERHLEAIQFRTVPAGLDLPVFQISPRSFQRIHVASAVDPNAQIEVEARVKWDERTLRTLVATIVGDDRPDEAVVTVSHVQEPGAGDNATGVAGLLESARVVAEAMVKGTMEWPSRSLVFIWGDEFRQTQVWLEQTKRTPVAGLSSDMTGQSRERTGAIALLERMPDPGALRPLAPDEHTPWGANPVDEEAFVPNGLAVIARCAIADVASLSTGGWVTAEHPWEGGSDHDEFIARSIPAALFWHFTDFSYHTSLDRLNHVDSAELRRTAIALLATALALADPEPNDLDRYLRTLQKERIMRVQAAEDAGDPELAEQWLLWCEGAREWLRVECLRIPPSRQ